MIKNILIATVILILTVGILVWADDRTDETNEFWAENDKCMVEETGMTTMQFYQATGEIMVCK